MPNKDGWLWCEELGLWLGLWHGEYLGKTATYPRFFDKNGEMVQTIAEREKQRTNLEKQRADLEKQRADSEKQRADSAEQRADLEKQRADEAEAELARLRAQHGPNGRRKK